MQFIRRHKAKFGFLLILFFVYGALVHYELVLKISPPSFAPQKPLPALNDEGTLIVKPRAKFGPPKEDVNDAKALYHFSLGTLASYESQYHEAISQFKKALEYDSKSAYIHLRAAEEYLKLSEFESAKSHVDTALKLDPEFADAHLLKGGIDAAEKKYEEAAAHYQKVIELDPKREQAYIFLATVYAEQEKYTDGIKLLNKLLHIEPQSYWAHYYLGRIYIEQGKPIEAVRAYRQSLRINPSFHLAALALGLHYELRDQVERAIQVYLEAIDRGDTSPRLLKRTVQLLLAKQDYARVLKLLEELKSQDPGDLNNRIRIGLIYYEIKDYDRAQHEFEELIKEYPESDRLQYYLSSVYEKLGKYDEAIQIFGKIKSGSEFYIDALNRHAFLLIERNQFEKAISLVEKAIEQKPQGKNGQLYEALASIYEKKEKFDEALNVLNKAKEKFPKDERLIYYTGTIYDKMGNFEKSMAVMRGVLKLNPNHADALNFIGYSYAIKGIHLNEAEDMIKKALSLKPGEGYIEDSLGWIYFIKGDYKRAKKYLEKAAILKSDEPVILDHLADLYIKLNDIKKAQSLYQKALELKPDKKTTEQIQKKLNVINEREKSKRFPAVAK